MTALKSITWLEVVAARGCDALVAEKFWRRLIASILTGIFFMPKSCDEGVAITLRRRGVAAALEDAVGEDPRPQAAPAF